MKWFDEVLAPYPEWCLFVRSPEPLPVLVLSKNFGSACPATLLAGVQLGRNLKDHSRRKASRDPVADRIATAIEHLSDRQDGPLHLSVTMAFASRWLMPRLPQLREQTGLSVAIEADDCVADLHASGIDMAIRYAEHPGTDAEWHRLFRDRILPVCAPGLLSGTELLAPDQVLALPLLHYRWRSGAANAPSWERWQAHAQVDGALPKPSQTFSEEVHALDAALAGQRAVLASEHLVGDQLKTGALLRVSDIALPGPAYWAVFLTNHSAKERLTKLLDWFRKQT